jgi:hypothetical protein
MLAMRDGWERQTAESVGARASACFAAHMPNRPFALNRVSGASADFCIACLWSALGLTLTGLFFARGLGAEIGQILAMAG